MNKKYTMSLTKFFEVIKNKVLLENLFTGLICCYCYKQIKIHV